MKFWDNSKRVFLVSRKPNWKEFWNLVKIVGLGILIIGVLGFLMKLVMYIFYAPK